MRTFAEIKEQYPIRSTLERIMPDGLRHRGQRYDVYICPFHDDVRPSFWVNDRTAHCEAGCGIAGREYGDVLDFVREYYGLHTWPEVIERLTGVLPDPPPAREIPKTVDKPLSWMDVQKGLALQDEALAYFQSRGLKEATVRKWNLGKYRTWPYSSLIEGKSYTFRCARYTLPDIAFGQVRNIELRMDEADAVIQLKLVDGALKESVAEQLQKKTGKLPTERELLSHFFGGKYTRVPHGIQRNLIGNVERVLWRVEHDGHPGWFSPDLPYVLVHEGLLKALVLEDACDDEFYYPSISAKGAPGLAALAGVKELIIVQDNEPNRIKPDGSIHNPGRDYAYRAVEASGRRLGQTVRIITAPEGLKAADDVVMAGQVHEWLSSLKIEPIRRPA